MNWKINDIEKTITIIDEEGNDYKTYKFLDEDDERFGDSYYNTYTYLKTVGNKLQLKHGKADKNFIRRYNHTDGRSNFEFVIRLGHNDITEDWKDADAEAHSKLVKKLTKNVVASGLNSYEVVKSRTGKDTEFYNILTIEGIDDILSIIDEVESDKQSSTRYSQPLFEDQASIVNHIIKLYDSKKFDELRVFLNLCMRFGKTSTLLATYQELGKRGVRIHILSAYVGTVNASYRSTCNSIKEFENILFVDVDEYKKKHKSIEKSIKEHLAKDKENIVVVYIQSTGDDDCFDSRYDLIKDIAKRGKTTLSIEEADNGTWREKQLKKYKKVKRCVTIVASGTGEEKSTQLFNGKSYTTIWKDYMLHILPVRENAVKLKYNLLSNSYLQLFGITKNEMENHSDMQTIENGQFRNHFWYEQLFRLCFDKNCLSIINVLDRKVVKLLDNYKGMVDTDPEVISLVYTTGLKATQEVMAKTIENALGKDNVEVFVLNGDYSTNKHAEDEVKEFYEKARKKNKRVFVISQSMGCRSFSVKQIKNVFLFYDAGDTDTTNQKCYRVTTPWFIAKDTTIHNYGYIIDCRLTLSGQGHLPQLFANTLQNEFDGSLEDKILTLAAADKVIFNDYTAKGITPFTSLTRDEQMAIMHSGRTYQKESLKMLCMNLKSLFEDRVSQFRDYNPEGSDLLKQLNKMSVKGDKDKYESVNHSKSESNRSNEHTGHSRTDGFKYSDFAINAGFFVDNYDLLQTFDEGKKLKDCLANWTDEKTETLQKFIGTMADAQFVVDIAKEAVKNACISF